VKVSLISYYYLLAELEERDKLKKLYVEDEDRAAEILPETTEVPFQAPIDEVAEPSTSYSTSVIPARPSLAFWKFPQHLMRPELLEAIKSSNENQTLLEGRLIRELIRTICLDIHLKWPKPGRAFLKLVAERVCEKVHMLKDQAGGEKIGSGFGSVAKKLEDRIDNLNRKSVTLSKKDSSKGEKHFRDALLPALPSEEEATAKTAIEIMKKSHKNDVDVGEAVKEQMDKSFNLIRKVIIEGKAVDSALVEELPYLFNKTCFFLHFERLTGVKIIKIQEKMKRDQEIYLKFFCSLKLPSSETVKEAFKQDKSNVMGYTFLILLAEYFKERSEEALVCVSVSELVSIYDL